MKLEIIGKLTADGHLPVAFRVATDWVLRDPENRRLTEPVRLRKATQSEDSFDFISGLQDQVWIFRDRIVSVRDVCFSHDRMEPTIHDGDLLVFRANPVGTRQGKIVLAQYRGPADPETGGSFTVKRYSSEKRQAEDGQWRYTQIVLAPTNRDYEPIVITPEAAEDFRIVAEFIAVIRPSV